MAKSIVIIGAGFAGLRAALDLDRHMGHDLDVPIYLIDPSLNHIYTPTLFEIVSKDRVRVPMVSLESLTEGTNIRLLQEKVIHIDCEARAVVTDRRRLAFGDLIIALGSEVVPAEDVRDEDYVSCRTVEDVMKLRQKLEDAVITKEPLEITVVGGGPMGIEFATGIRAYVDATMDDNDVNRNRVTITLKESAKRILPNYDEKVSKVVAGRLKKHNITVQTGVKVTASQLRTKASNHVTTWTAGLRAHRLVRDCKGVRHDEQGRIVVDATLQALGHERIWVAGDSASFIDSGTMPAAVRHGGHVAANIVRARADALPQPYYPKDDWFMLQLGTHDAIAWRGPNIKLGKAVGWQRRLRDLKYFLSILPIARAVPLWLSRGRLVMEGDAVCFEAGTP